MNPRRTPQYPAELTRERTGEVIAGHFFVDQLPVETARIVAEYPAGAS